MKGILLSVLRWITGDLAGKLLDAYRAKLEAANETEKVVADVAIEEVKAQIAARAAAKEIRLSTAGYWEMRTITAVIGGCATAHYVAVTLDTIGKFGWRIPKFPEPFDQYQGTILLSFFGVQGAAIGFTAIAAAIRGRK